MNICGCCDDEARDYYTELMAMPKNERERRIRNDLEETEVEPWVIQDMVNILLKEENDNQVIRKCKDFLTLSKGNEFAGLKGYITIWSFAYDYLGLHPNTYAYILLSWLEELELMEHGCAIRCGWPTFEPYHIDNETVTEMVEWAKNVND